MEEKKKKKTLPIIIALVVVGSLLVLFGTYAYWQLTAKQTNRNKLATGCLDVTYTNETGDIDLDELEPMSDGEAASLVPYTFKITNRCSGKINYTISLESLEDEEEVDGLSGADLLAKQEELYVGYNYIKVKVDSDTPVVYGESPVVVNDSEALYTIRDTKKIADKSLAGGQYTTHSIRIWLKEGTPLSQINKEFLSKVRIDAVNAPKPSLKLLYTYNGWEEYEEVLEQPKVTTSNIHLGDRVGFEGEEFYVVGIDGNNIKLLTRYALNVGDYVNPNGTEGLQYAELVGTKTDLSEEYAEEYYLDTDEDFVYYGSMDFSDDIYWYNMWTNRWISPYSADDSFIYDDNSNLKDYVDDYVETLQEMGLAATSGTLLSEEEVYSLCNNTGVINMNRCSNAWYLFETSYWLGSTTLDTRPIYVCAFMPDGLSAPTPDYGYILGIGVRPVINVALS